MGSTKEVENQDFKIIEVLTVTIMSFSYIGLFFSGFIFQNPSYNQIVGILGWIIWIIGLCLAFSTNIVFKRRGEVPEGKSYVNTTKLVDDGIFGIMRHPQYTGGMVIAFSMCLIVQTPLTYILAITAIVTAYLSMILEENNLIKKFGSQYKNYQTKVPRVNFILGIIRKIRRSKSEN